MKPTSLRKFAVSLIYYDIYYLFKEWKILNQVVHRMTRLLIFRVKLLARLQSFELPMEHVFSSNILHVSKI